LFRENRGFNKMHTAKTTPLAYPVKAPG
jgi:hypothetical protein